MTMYHISLNIDGTLAQSDEAIDGIIGEPGRAYSAKEVREFLLIEKEKGYTRFTGCDSRTEDGGCAGHEEPEDKIK